MLVFSYLLDYIYVCQNTSQVLMNFAATFRRKISTGFIPNFSKKNYLEIENFYAQIHQKLHIIQTRLFKCLGESCQKNAFRDILKFLSRNNGIKIFYDFLKIYSIVFSICIICLYKQKNKEKKEKKSEKNFSYN